MLSQLNPPIVATDSGTNTSWCARFIDIRDDMMFSVSGNLASMACGLPYAIAAAIAFPDRPVVALVGIARACGVRGYSITAPDQCADVLHEAFNRPGPALIEAVVDPNEPPLPPKATFEQAKHLVEALARGTPDAGAIARNIAREKIRELV